VAQHLHQVQMIFQPPFCGQRNRRFFFAALYGDSFTYAPVFSPNRLIVDEATADDNSGKVARCRLVYIADYDSSRYPQPSNDGAAFSFPW